MTRRAVEKVGCCQQCLSRGELQADMTTGDAALQVVGRSLRDDPALVEDGDMVGELIGLAEVLRREKDCDAASHETANAFPHRVAAARV